MRTLLPPTATHNTDPARLAGAGLRTFFRIADAWGLSVEQQMALLGQPGRSTLFQWRKQPPARLQPDVLERLSYVFGIYKNLEILLPDPSIAREWVRRPNTNPLYGGRPPIERMCMNMGDLYQVRRHLDWERGG